MAVEALSPARPARKPGRWFVSPRALTGAFLFGVTVLVGLTMFRPHATRSMLAATHDLMPGHILSDADIRETQVRLEGDTYAAVMPGAERSQVVGKLLAEPVHRGELLTRSAISGDGALAPGTVAVTVVPDPDKGRVAGVRPGDFVQVFVTYPSENNGPRETELVLRNARVHAVGYPEDGTLGSDGGGSSATADWLSLAVNETDAAKLIRAQRSGDIDVALLPAGGSR
jgi:Flp pilus assembly protein CpaB